MTKEINTPYGVNLWRSIRVLWPSLENRSSIKVVNGSETIFWKDKWLGIKSLQEKFPDIYNLVLHQHNTMAEQWSNQG